jgi:hypothetical protein
MDPVALAAKVAEILRANPDGISRAGLMAWARLRVTPDLTDEQLDAALAALGSSVVVHDGYARLVEGPEPAAWASPVTTSGSGRTPAPSSSPLAPSPPPPTSVWARPEPTAPEERGLAARAAEPGTHDGAGPWRDGSAGDASGEVAPAVPPGQAAGAAATQSFSTVALLEAGGASTPPEWTPGSRPSRRRLALLPVLALVMIGLVAYAGLDGSSGSPPGSTLVPGDPAGTIVGADSLQVGACIVFPGGNTFSDIETRPCDVSHDAEIVSVWEYRGGARYPTDAEWEAQADPACRSALEAYTGRSADVQPELTYGWFVPAEDSWAAGSRTVQCYIGAADGGHLDRSYRGG